MKLCVVPTQIAIFGLRNTHSSVFVGSIFRVALNGVDSFAKITTQTDDLSAKLAKMNVSVSALKTFFTELKSKLQQLY